MSDLAMCDLAMALAHRLPHGWTDDDGVAHNVVSRGNYEDAKRILDALAAEGIACVYVPEGVTVPHGSRLGIVRTRHPATAIPLLVCTVNPPEDTP